MTRRPSFSVPAFAALGLTLGLLAAPAAHAAAPAPETFALGKSAASGAVCDAVRDYQDPVAQGAGARAWRVRCRGYTTVLGRIYDLPTARRTAWESALKARAVCQPGKPLQSLAKTPAALAACRTGEGQTPYVALSAARGKGFVAAEGLAPLADVLETGLGVAAGTRAAPAMTAVGTSAAQAEIAADFPDLGGLAAAEAAAAADPQRLRARGYVQNNEWRFDEAETVFRALVTAGETRNDPATDRAEALLNLAINVSNNGRYDEAEVFFEEAQALIASDNLLLRAQAQVYRALHERNRGRFDSAIAAAQGALAIRPAAAAKAASISSGSAGGALVIDDRLAKRLNAPSAAQDLIEAPRVTLADQLELQAAQADQVIGTSKLALGDRAGARAALLQARDILVRNETLGRMTPWLHAQVEADLAALDLADGRAAQAVTGYGAALAILRTRHAGSSAEGAMLLDLGQAQVAAGAETVALGSFSRAVTIFSDQRGGLGGSADATAPYFDLLLRRIDSDPANATAYRAQFFDTAETVVSSATASTVNRLAARVAAGSGAVAGLARAYEDAGRRVRATESAIAALQADGGYSGAQAAELDAQLKTDQGAANALEAQLLAANPGYNQLVAPGAPVSAIQKALRPGEVYVKLLPLAGRAYGIAVTRDSVKPYAIDLGRDELETAVEHLRAALELDDNLRPFDVAASGKLFAQLFGPVRGELSGARHLIYEPSGALISLPAAVFVTAPPPPTAGEADYSKVAWLGAKLDSSLVLSGASFLQSRALLPSTAPKPFLGFGDPAMPRAGEKAYSAVLRSSSRRRGGPLERVCGATRDSLLHMVGLPETEAEVHAVGGDLGAADSVVTGAAFSDDVVRARTDLKDYQVLYFATHSLLPQPGACVDEPALVTSLGQGDSDALLDSDEILGLNLDADLVVLAACNTGSAGGESDRTGLTGGGEALGGLTRAMIYAGSRAMIVSHWSVDSASTVRLMTSLFASGAPTVADGLRLAQAAVRSDPTFAHPYFWAPFTLVGDGDRALPKSSRVVASTGGAPGAP